MLKHFCLASTVLVSTVWHSHALANDQAYAALDVGQLNQQIVNSVKLIKTHQYAAACQQLENLPDTLYQTQRQIGLNSLFLKGQCQAGLGNYATAQGYFETLIKLDPKPARPYLDLALIYQYQGQYSAATRLYKQLSERQDLSETVQDHLDQLLAQRPDAWQWRVTGHMGGISDSNINNAPVADSIRIYDLEFIFNSESRPRTSTGMQLGGQAYISKLFTPKRRMQLNMSIDTISYGEHTDFNSQVLQLSGAYQEKRWGGEVMIQPKLAMVSVGGDSLLDVMGLDLAYSYLKSDQTRITTLFGYHNYGYSQDVDRDKSVMKPEIRVDYQWSDKLLLQWGAFYGMGGASVDHYSYTALGLDVGVDYHPFSGMVASFQYQMERVDYSSAIPGFEEVRADQLSQMNLMVNYNWQRFSLPWLTTEMGLRNYTNTSNVALFEYDRRQIYFQLQASY